MDLQEHIKATLVNLRTVDAPEKRPLAVKELHNIIRHLKASDEKPLSSHPRRGALYEYINVLELVPELVTGINREQVLPTTEHDISRAVAVELWREAECIVRQPHSFAALRHIPELQQIIAHTAVTAVTACAGQLSQLRAYAESTDDAGAGHATSAAAEQTDDLLASEACQKYCKDFLDDDTHLLDHLIPALRLCLAAEVAAGMLCPSQPPPPDTPEHAAALNMFVQEAYKHVEAELLGDDNALQPHGYNTANSLQNMWSHITDMDFSLKKREQQQEEDGEEEAGHCQGSTVPHPDLSGVLTQQQEGQPAPRQQQQQQQLLYPKSDGDIPKWPLTPHLNLHMHLPPVELLLLLLHKCGLVPDQQQKQKQQGGQQHDVNGLSGTGTLGSRSTKMGDSSLSAWDGLHEKYQSHLENLFSHLRAESAAVRAAQHAQHGSSAACSSNGASEPGPAPAITELLSACVKLRHLLQKSHHHQAGDHQHGPQQPGSAHVQQGSATLITGLAQAAAMYTDEQQQWQGEEQQHHHHQVEEQEDGHWQKQQQQPSNNDRQVADADTLEISSDPGYINSVSSDDSSSSFYTSTSRAQANPGKQQGGSPQITNLLLTLLSSLVLQFVADSWQAAAAGSSAALIAWQQEVAVQVLLLMAQAQQIRGLIQKYGKVCCTAADGSSESPESSSSSSNAGGRGGADDMVSSSKSSKDTCTAQASIQQQQPLLQRLLWHVQGFLQLLRQFRDSNAAMNVHAAVPTANNTAQSDRAGQAPAAAAAVSPVSPAEFFSAAGPLAAGLCGIQAGQPLTASAAAAGAEGVVGLEDVTASSCSSSSEQPLPVQGFCDLIWQTFLGCCCWEQASTAATQATLEHLADDADLVSQIVQHMAVQQAGLWRDEDFALTINILHQFKGSWSLQDLLPRDELLQMVCIPDQVREYAQTKRLRFLQEQGYNLSQWKAALEAAMQRVQHMEEIMDRVTVKTDEMLVMNSDFLTAEDNAYLAGRTAESNEWLAALAQPSTAAAASSSSSEDWDLQHELDKGITAYRRLGLRLCQLCAPLYHCHINWFNNNKQQQQQAMAWWNSSSRKLLAQQGCREKERPALQSDDSNASNSSTTTNSRMWKHSLHDRHPNCPLCQQEQQQQQQQPMNDTSHGSSGHSQQQQQPSSAAAAAIPNPYTHPAVSPADPFMWRRLLWQLLGRLSPAAQAFYAQYFAMCPHCMSEGLWVLVSESIAAALWSPPTADVMDMQLNSTPHSTMGHHKERAARVRQYATAVNTAYLQVHSPAAVLVAKQLLVALSSLHQSVLPPADVAPYLPSSFTPAVGKLLQQQIISRPVMDSFAHESCQLLPWHVWWHVGVRRYHQMEAGKQQQQQLDCHQSITAGVPRSSSSSRSTSNGAGSDVDAVYLDPDARLYAVGFATRQLHNCRFDDYGRSGSGSCIASGTAESAPHFLQMALQQRAQDCINDCLDCSLSDCAEQMTGISLKQLLKEADDGSFWAITMRHRYGEAVTHLKLCLMLRVFNAVSSLVSKPVHALASSERQQRPEMPARFMLCTTTVLRYAAESGVPGAGEAAIADNSSEVCQAVTDVHQLALLSPAPVEALVDPAVWWEWQKRILQLDSSCDVCGTSKQSSEAGVVCSDCGIALYCSSWCLNRDKEQHAPVCRKLQHAKQRYSPSSTAHARPCTPEAAAAAAKAHPPFQLLLTLLNSQGAGGVLDVQPGLLDDLSPGIVEPGLFILAAGQLLEKLSLVRPMSASDRVMAEKARDKLKRRQQQEQQHEQ